MDLGKFITDVATAPVRAGVAAGDIGIAVGAYALGLVKQSLGEDPAHTVVPVSDVLPVRGAIVGANRVAELTEDDRAMGRVLARGGLADKLTRPGGVADLLSAPGGLLDRVSVEGSALERILEPGGLVERMLSVDGPIERLLSEDGIVDKLTAKDGPLEQLTEQLEILSRLQPAVEALTPTADTLESAVDTLNRMVASLSNITDRIPRRRAARSVVPPKSIEG